MPLLNQTQEQTSAKSPLNSNEQNEQQNFDLNSAFVSDLGIVKTYPKSMTPDEITYDIYTNVRKNSPEDYYENYEPGTKMVKAVSSLMNSIDMASRAAAQKIIKGAEILDQSMKFTFTSPDVAMGFRGPETLTDEDTAKIYKDWYDLWRESPVGSLLRADTAYPEAFSKIGTKRAGAANLLAVPWFLFEFMPSELADWGTKPQNWVAAYAVEKAAPKMFDALPPNIKSLLLKDVFKRATASVDDFAALGVHPNAPTKEVTKAYKNAALKAHPDRGGSVEAMQRVNQARANIMESRKGFINKLYDKYREAFPTGPKTAKPGSKPKLSLSSESGSADLVPNFEPGDLAKLGKDTVKVLNVVGEKALINQAGKQVEVALSKLKTHPKNIEMTNEENPALKKAKRIVELSESGELGKSKTNDIAVKKAKQFIAKTEGQAQQVANPSSSNPPEVEQQVLQSELIISPPENPPVEPPVEPPVVAAGQPEEPTGPMAINPKRTDIPQEKIVNATAALKNTLENQTGAVLTHEQVIEQAKNAEVLDKSVDIEHTKKLAAQLLATRQRLSTLATNPELTPEFLKAFEVDANQATEIARLLESRKIKVSAGEYPAEWEKVRNGIIDKLFKLGKTRDELLAAAKGVDFTNPDQAAEFYRKFVKPSLEEQLNEFAYINILSSPITHIKNMFANTLQMVGINPATKLLSGKGGQIGPYYQAAFSKLPDALSQAFDVIQGKQFVARPDVHNLPTKAKWISAATLGLGKYIPRALEAGDILTRAMIEAGEKAALASEIKGEITPEQQAVIDKKAAEKAEYYVFRAPLDPSNESGQGDLLSTIDRITSLVYKIRNDFPGAKWFVRFVQTPMNILKQGIEYSPAGVFTLKGNKNKQEQIGKAMLGSFVFAGASYLAAKGRLTWSLPKGESDRALYYQAGLQPFSVNVAAEGKNPIWVSYSQLGPLSYPIAMAAALHYHTVESSKALSDSVMQKAINSLSGTMEFFSEQSYMKGIGDLIKVMRGEPQALTDIMTTMPVQMIPLSSLQGWVNTLIDPLYRKPAKGLSWQSVGDNLQKRIIGLSGLVPAAPDLMGMPQENKDRFLNALSPMRVKVGSPDWEKLYRIKQAGDRLSNKIEADAQKGVEKSLQENMKKSKIRSNQ